MTIQPSGIETVETIEFESSVEFNECKICKKCCISIFEGVCGYHIIQAIKEKRVPQEYISKLVIFRIPTHDIDWVAEEWVHFPWVNILTLMTKENHGVYEFLMMPAIETGCPLASENGCKNPDLKLFDCRLFPYYFNRGKFYTENECAFVQKLDIDTMRAETKKMTEEYIAFSQLNQNNYAKDLEVLRSHYKIPTYSIADNSNSLSHAYAIHKQGKSGIGFPSGHAVV
jgi:Fe-S-cluster containining protein